MTTVITPSILAENIDQYKEQIERITGFAERAHIDISDGQFAPNLTVGLRDLWAPEGWQIDIHAMVKNVDEYIEDLVALRPNMILLHAESDGDVLGALQKIKQADIKAGLVLMRPTVPSTVVDLIKAADHVMIFSGELGRFGAIGKNPPHQRHQPCCRNWLGWWRHARQRLRLGAQRRQCFGGWWRYPKVSQSARSLSKYSK